MHALCACKSQTFGFLGFVIEAQTWSFPVANDQKYFDMIKNEFVKNSVTKPNFESTALFSGHRFGKQDEK